MTLERLIQALLAAEAELHPEDLLDALWLASRKHTLSLGDSRARDAGAARHESSKPSGALETIASPATAPAPPPPPEPAAPASTASSTESVSAFAPGTFDSAQPSRKASPVSLPAGSALTDKLALARAFRPFRQRRLSDVQFELDEELTAELSAELGAGRVRPVYRPVLERWFHVDVVMEDDDAIGLWRDTLRDFCQVMRQTGAFRDVRLWNLHMPESGNPFLTGSGYARLPARAFGDFEPRRLILFATHGDSPRWIDGGYGQLLQPWTRASKVALLNLRAREQWKRTLLGEPLGQCRTLDPTSVTSSIEFERDWWKAERAPTALKAPVVALAPDEIATWALMQMARGRRSPGLLVETDSLVADIGEADSLPIDYDFAVALLREASPESFRLGVYLCTGPFTLPVARLVQEAMFGRQAQQHHLAELLLSGLIVTRSPRDASTDPNSIYYELAPEATEILRRSLRGADEVMIAGALESRLSEYIESIDSRRDARIKALVPDASGQYDLPEWAQPFARLRTSILPAQPVEEQELNLFVRLRAYGDNMLFRAAHLAAFEKRLSGGPDEADPLLLEALVASEIRAADSGPLQWNMVAMLELLEIAEELLRGINVTWVDATSDRARSSAAHKNHLSVNFKERLRRHGAIVTTVRADSIFAMDKESAEDVLIVETSNDLALRSVMEEKPGKLAIQYARGDEPSAEARMEALSAGAFGCTGFSSEVFELVLEAVGRSSRTVVYPWLRTALSALEASKTPSPRHLVTHPAALSNEISRRFAQFQDQVLAAHLEVIRGVSKSDVHHVILRDGDKLHVVGHLIGEGKESSQYDIASWDGLIGRAMRSGETVWEPDVTEAQNYLAAEPSTLSELVVPLRLENHAIIGAINIEFDRKHSLRDMQRRWLQDYCQTLALLVYEVPIPARRRQPKRSAAEVRIVLPRAMKEVVEVFDLNSDELMISADFAVGSRVVRASLPIGRYRARGRVSKASVEFLVERVPDIVEVLLAEPHSENADVSYVEDSDDRIPVEAKQQMEEPPRRVSKKIVVCIDELWGVKESSARVEEPFSAAGVNFEPEATNVYKLFELLPSPTGDEIDDDRALHPTQIKSYLSGPVRPEHEFELGLSKEGFLEFMGTVLHAHASISRSYSRGDSIHLVGFSKGAHAALALAEMIAGIGLVQVDDSLEMTDGFLLNAASYEAWKSWRNLGERRRVAGKANLPEAVDVFGSRVELVHDVTVKSVAVWENVGWQGIPDMDHRLTPYRLSAEIPHERIEHVFHAMALDEEHARFPISRVGKRAGVEELWFVGSHRDVGGGVPRKESRLADISLKWMCEKLAQLGVEFALAPPPVNNRMALDPIHVVWPSQRSREATRLAENDDALHSSVIERWRLDETYRPAALTRFESTLSRD